MKPSVREFFTFYSPAVSAEAVRDFLSSDVLRLDHQDAEPYHGGQIWAGKNRTLSRKTHGWFFLRYWSASWDQIEPSERTELCTYFASMVEKWRSFNGKSQMFHHDETTAQRLINFVAFRESLGDDLASQIGDQVDQVVEEDLKLLVSPDFYAGRNNHGMFQDIAILVALASGYQSDRADEYRALAIGRLISYFTECFTPDGIHKENSPSYHLMVSGYVSKVMRYCDLEGIVGESEALHSIFSGADKYGAFALTPANSFTPVSDTSHVKVSEYSVRRGFGDNAMLGVLSHGALGRAPESRTFVSEQAGYGIFRSSWDADSSYLFFSAAYNADYHKHSDELSVYLYAHGRPLLAESGPNGYEYSDPLTKYAFSSWAHNTILVDGEGLPRIDKKANETTLTDIASTTNKLHVRGRTTRYSGAAWSREIVVGDEGKFVQVSDEVECDEEKRITFLWHLGEGLLPVVRGNAVEIFDQDGSTKLAEMIFHGDVPEAVRAVHGQRHPYHQGWIFPRMGTAKKAYAIEVDIRGIHVSQTWEIRTENFKLIDRGVYPSSKWESFAGEKPVNYLLDRVADQNVESLIVAFTAMPHRYDFTYNYRASLQESTQPVLYILDDFGDQGSYYLAGGRNFAEFRSVQGLIRKTLEDLGLTAADTVFLGSSKGATAALLHGVATGAGQILAGAPQYRIGDFVAKPHPNVLQYIAGDTTGASVRWLNQIPLNLLMSGLRSSQISVVVGKKDAHYRNHTVPLVDDLRMLGYSAEHLVLPGTGHSELGAAFRGMVSSMVQVRETDEDVAFSNTMAFDPEPNEIGLIVGAQGNTTIQAQLFRGAEPIEGLKRVLRGHARWTIDAPGHYRARLYYDDSQGNRRAFGSTAVDVTIKK